MDNLTPLEREMLEALRQAGRDFVTLNNRVCKTRCDPENPFEWPRYIRTVVAKATGATTFSTTEQSRR